MILAIAEAKKAYQLGEVPVGAVIIKEGKILAKGHNLVETKRSVLAHAELIVIEKASKKLNNWRLNGTTLIVTLEPCLTCFGAIAQSRISKLIFGAYDFNKGAISMGLKFDLEVMGGVLEVENHKLLDKFFKEIRGD
jgi:tRNA(adenine34) deaminase